MQDTINRITKVTVGSRSADFSGLRIHAIMAVVFVVSRAAHYG